MPRRARRFICSFDGSSFSACTSSKTYTGLGQGGHTFRVEAKDSSGHTSDAASYSWTIDLHAAVDRDVVSR